MTAVIPQSSQYSSGKHSKFSSPFDTNKQWDDFTKAEQNQCLDTQKTDLVDGKNIWAASGLIGAKWEAELYTLIVDYLNARAAKIFKTCNGREVLYVVELYMIGSPDYFRPTVVATCANLQVANSVLRLVKKQLSPKRLGFAYLALTRRIVLAMQIVLERSRGIIGRSSVGYQVGTEIRIHETLPDPTSAPPIGGTGDIQDGLQRGIPTRPPPESEFEPPRPDLSHEPAITFPTQNMCGLRVRIKTSDGAHVETTIGGCLEIGKQPYGMTAAHVLRPRLDDQQPYGDDWADNAPQALEYDSDGSASTSASDDEINEEYDDQTPAQPIADEAYSWVAASKQAHSSLKGTPGYPKYERMSRYSDPQLDWLLIPLDDEESEYYNIARINGKICRLNPILDASSDSEAFVVGGLSGMQPARLTTTSCTLFMPGSGRILRTWAIHHKIGTLRQGDSGSWVVDANGQVYGHLVAITEGGDTSYVAPLNPSLDSICAHLGESKVYFPTLVSSAHLSVLGEDFLEIPYGNFESCAKFLEEHPKLLTEDPRKLYKEAIRAHQDSNDGRKEKCMQKCAILRKCHKANTATNRQWFQRLINGDQQTTSQFEADCQKLLSEIASSPENRESVRAGALVPRSESHDGLSEPPRRRPLRIDIQEPGIEIAHTTYGQCQRTLNPERFFIEGRVFAFYWNSTHVDEAGEQLDRTVCVGTGNHHERIFAHVRTMVVVEEGEGACWASPIMTYDGECVAHPRLNPLRRGWHCLVHQRWVLPYVKGSERGLLTKSPIEVDVDDQVQPVRDKHDCALRHQPLGLDLMSRLDYSKRFVISWSLKVIPIGMVSEASMRVFEPRVGPAS